MSQTASVSEPTRTLPVVGVEISGAVALSLVEDLPVSPTSQKPLQTW